MHEVWCSGVMQLADLAYQPSSQDAAGEGPQREVE